jgi:polyphosphate kinase
MEPRASHHPDPRNLTKGDRAFLDAVFLTKVFPGALAAGDRPGTPVPLHPQCGFSLALQLERKSRQDAQLAGAAADPAPDRPLRPPARPSRADPVPAAGRAAAAAHRQLFPGYELAAHCSFRVLRDSDLEVEEEAEDLVREFEVALKRRRRGEVVRLQISGARPNICAGSWMRAGCGPAEVIDVRGMIGVADLSELVIDDRPTCSGPSSPRACPNACRTMTATCSPPSGRRTCCCTTPTRPSTWWCASCSRPRAIRTWWRSSRRSTAPRATAPSSRPCARRRRTANRSPRWSN